jgi:hypothetical protein
VDERQRRQVNEAAEKFAESLTEAYRAVTGRSVSAQELNAQLTQEFFNGVINNLRTQAESNRALAEDLIEQQRKQQEASQALAQESVNAYTDFLNSVFSLPREAAKAVEGATREAGTERSVNSGGEEDAAQDDAVRHPLSSWMETSSGTPVAPPVDGAPPDAASLPDEEHNTVGGAAGGGNAREANDVTSDTGGCHTRLVGCLPLRYCLLASLACVRTPMRGESF